MSNWKATSVSGTEYCGEHGYIRVYKHGEHVSTTKLWGKTRTTIKPGGYEETPWGKNSTEWVDSGTPRVGFCFYFAGKDNWRITAIIAKVEILGEQ